MGRIVIMPEQDEKLWAKIKRKARQAKMDAQEWYTTHKLEVLIFGPLIIGIGTTLLRFGCKQISMNREQNLKDLYVYDRVLGHYWKLRRKLTNQEWLAVEARKKAGEDLGKILEDLNALKY